MNIKETAIKLFKDIRFWILFFFLLRMYGITMPPLEIGHNWRQTDGMMIARNFYERSPNILYPMVDLAGEKSGIVGCEFPILNYLVYLLSVVFGYHHWFGRLIVLITSSIGVYFFYKLIKKYFDASSAFNASIILLVSLWFSYSRKNIPDAFAASLCIISLYNALQYFDSGKLSHLVWFFFLCLLGCLSKILTAAILTVLVIPVLSPTILLKRKLILSLLSAVILASVGYWYFIWIPHLNQIGEFSEHFFTGMSFQEGINAIWKDFAYVAQRFYDTPLKYSGFVTFSVSLFYIIKKKYWLHLSLFSLVFFFYLLMFIRTGSSITGDRYYIITLIPAMAFVAGFGLAQLKNKKMVATILLVITLEGLADQIYDFRTREPYTSLLNLEAIMDSVSERNDLIAINSSPNYPTPMYFAHRRGWGIYNEWLNDPNYVAEIKSKGCKFIVIAKELSGDATLEYPVVHESKYFKIYSLNK